MGKHFSSQELYELRNHIPMDVLIEKELAIPSKISEGFSRFLCPLCNEFQTAINPKTNLGRCFRCQTNFNTIDMVMGWHKTGFIDSFLSCYNKNLVQGTCKLYRAYLRGFLRYLYQQGHIRKDLASLVVGPPEFARSTPPKFLRPEEVQKLFSVRPKTPISELSGFSRRVKLSTFSITYCYN